MRSLFLDTSSNYIHIYIIENENILIDETLVVEKDMSNKILPLVRESFNKLQFTINDLDKLFVTIGPGSFTGVRIGIAFVKTVAWSLNIPVYPISTLEYLACLKDNRKDVISIIDARRGNVFAGYYNFNLNKLEDEKLIPFADICNSDDIELVSFDGCYNSKKCEIDILKLLQKHKNDVPINPHDLTPNYLKKTEAEEKLND